MAKQVSFLYIVRHGESMSNTTQTVLPSQEDVLTEHGKVQVELLGEHLKHVKFTKAYSSDYERSVETASTILAKSEQLEVTKLKLQLDERIRELNAGIYEGGSFRDVLAFLAENIFDKGIGATDVEIPGGDSPVLMLERTRSFFKDIFHTVDNSNEGETILAASHGYCILFLVKYLLSSPDQLIISNATDIISKIAPNTGVIILAIHPLDRSCGLRKIQVLAEHDTKHLESLRKNDVLHTYAKTTRFDGCVHQ